MLRQLQKLRWLRLITSLVFCLAIAGCGALGSNSLETEPTVMSLADFYATFETELRMTATLPIPEATIRADKTPHLITGSDFNNAWLEGDPCALPCWQGITPHETTLAEALELLSVYPEKAISHKI